MNYATVFSVYECGKIWIDFVGILFPSVNGFSLDTRVTTLTGSKSYRVSRYVSLDVCFKKQTPIIVFREEHADEYAVTLSLADISNETSRTPSDFSLDKRTARGFDPKRHGCLWSASVGGNFDRAFDRSSSGRRRDDFEYTFRDGVSTRERKNESKTK